MKTRQIHRSKFNTHTPKFNNPKQKKSEGLAGCHRG